MRLSTKNLLSSLTGIGTSIGTYRSAPPTAVGYSVMDAFDGTLARVWRSNLNTVFTFAFNPLKVGDNKHPQIYAVMAAKSLDNANMYRIEVQTANNSSFTGFTAEGAANFVTVDGVNSAVFVSPNGGEVTDRIYRRIVVTTLSTTTIQIGEIWIGDLVSLDRDHTSLTAGYLNHNITYEHPAGVTYAKKIGASRKSFQLGFEKFLPGEAAVMAQIDSDTEGCLNPIMLEVDSKWYHGRLQNNRSWQVDFPLTDRYDWQFVESGRVA